MPNLPFSTTGETPFKKILGHNALVHEKWVDLEKVFFGHRGLGPELLEQVRRVIAFSQGCHYWMAHGGAPDEVHQDKRVAAAVSFAKQAMEDPHQLTGEAFDQLKSFFSTEEVSTLCAFIAFMSGATRFGVMVDLTASDAKK